MNGAKLRSQLSTSSEPNPPKMFDTRASRHSRTRADDFVDEISTGDNSGTSDAQAHSAKPSSAASKTDENCPSRSFASLNMRQEGSHARTKTSLPHAKTRGGSSHPWPFDGRGLRCKVKGCRESPSYSFDGRRPAVRCGNHRETKMYRVEHIDKKKCGEEGCARPAQVSYMSQNGRIGRFCSEHRKPEVIVTTSETTCQYEGCTNEPRYGARKGPLSFCSDHKRVGMYTNRNGQLMVATRDGSAFQLRRQFRQKVEAVQGTTISDAVIVPETKVENVGVRSPVGGPRQDSKPIRVAAADDCPNHVARKLCEVPGCEVQPSYGIKGTRKALFCTNHKGPGMVALKNRPCAFTGCDTRPHYGVSGGRPVFCARHRQRGMVHILKQQNSMQKEATARKRAEAKRKTAAQKNTLEKPEEAETHIPPPQLPVDDKKEEGDQRPGKGSDRKGAGAPVASTVKTGKDGLKREKTCSASFSLSSSSTLNPVMDSKQRASSPTAEEPMSTSSSTTVGRISPTSTAAGTVTGPPSGEVCTLKVATESARESARAAAAASGSGRRPRAPSLKALEASGMATGEGAQLMTKEKKEEQARKLREYKEQRRAFAAARLEAKKLLAGNLNGSVDKSQGFGAVEGRAEASPESKAKVDEKQQKLGKEKHAGNIGGASVKATDVAAGTSGVKKRAATELTGNLSEDGAVTGETLGTTQGQPTPSKRARASSMGNVGRGDGEKDHAKKQKSNESTDGKAKRRRTGAGATAATISCLDENCSKVATHGINNTLRFCKEHALFGMYEIDNSA